MAVADTIRGFLDRIVDYARRRPAVVLAWMLGFHLVVWTLVPALISANLQLDLVEGLALGKEWQLGYWKHPPLPWWVTDLAYRLTGQIDAVYILGPLAAAICLYAVWLLAREVAGETKALIAVAALAAIHYYNISVVKFAHDQMQLPFWALTGLFFWRAIVRGRTTDWMLAGAVPRRRVLVEICRVRTGGDARPDPAVRSVRAARLAHARAVRDGRRVRGRDRAEYLVADQQRLHAVPLCRRARRGGGTLVSISPVSRCAGPAASLLYLLPALALLALLYLPRRPVKREAASDETAFNRRYVAALALGPFAVTTIVAAVLGRRRLRCGAIRCGRSRRSPC